MKKLFFFAIPLLASSLMVSGLTQASADDSGDVSSESIPVIESVQEYNTYFDVPEYVKDGKKYQSVFIMPDGSATKESKVLLNQIGTYTIKYSIIDNKVPKEEIFTFVVKNQYFYFSGPNSFAKYTTGEDTSHGQAGLYVSLAKNETLKFNETLDMRGSKKKEPYIDFFVAPKDIGRTDFMELDFTLTDVSDSANTLRTRCKGSQEGINSPFTYVDVSGDDQAFVGVERNKVHTNSSFGCATVHSFYGYYGGNYSNKKYGECTLTLSYDESEKASYAAEGILLIADHDNSAHYAALWDGFKTGIVNLSISATSYVGDNASFVIKDIRGLDLRTKVIEDNEKPVITLNTPYDINDLPRASVGNYYPVFEAIAHDNDGRDYSVTSEVFYNPSEGKLYKTSVENGYFKVNREGQYVIRYKASDAVGCTQTLDVYVKTSNTIEDLSIIPLSNIKETSKQGESYSLPSFKVKGGSGRYDNQYQVTLNGKEIEVKDGKIRPTEIGVYNVIFTATDIRLVSESYSYTLAVIYNSDPVFIEEAKLPRYFLAGFKNKIPALYATDYSKNGKQVLADVEINDGTSTKTLKSGDYFTPEKREDLTNLEITYVAGNSIKTYNVNCAQVYEDRYIKMEKYFTGDNYEADTSIEGRTKFNTKTAGTSTINFINPLPATNTSLLLSMANEETTFKAMFVTFEDKYNPNQKVTIRIDKNNTGNISASNNGKIIKSDLKFVSNASFTVSCFENTFALEKSEAIITAFDNGDKFTGFDSQFVYVSISTIGTETSSSFYIEQICNQTISYLRADRSEPIITVNGNYGGVSTINSIQETIDVLACDVLDPSVEANVSVTKPRKDESDVRYVLDSRGEAIENRSVDTIYQFIVDEYGQFIVTYKAIDTRGNEATFAYSVGVLDEEKPTIVITSQYTTATSVGSCIILPTYKVIDNYDENPKSYINIITPNGVYYPITGKTNSIQAISVGVYRVRITAIDNSGNISYFEYSVTVK